MPPNRTERRDVSIARPPFSSAPVQSSLYYLPGMDRIDFFLVSIPPNSVDEFESRLRARFDESSRLVLTENEGLDHALSFAGAKEGSHIARRLDWWRPWTLRDPREFDISPRPNDLIPLETWFAVSKEDGLMYIVKM